MLPQQVGRIAARQHGVVHHHQLLTAGVSPSTIARWARDGRLIRLQPKVYAVAGAPPTWERSLMAAIVATGGVASHRAAARVWGLLDDESIDVTVERNRSATLDGVTVHRTTLPLETMVRRGIPTMTPPCTLVFLGAATSQEMVADVAHLAMVRRLVTIDGLEAALGRLSKQGAKGTSALRRVLDEWELGKRPPDSVLETTMSDLVRRHRLPRPQFQVKVPGVGRVDFLYAEHRIAIEVEGNEFHSTPEDRRRDARRRNALVANGWALLVFTWLEVKREGRDVADTIRRQLAIAA